MKTRVQYTLGRLASAASRPLILFLANNYLSPATAQALAVAFLATTLALLAVAADPHRQFYARRFATEPSSHGLVFQVYLASLALLTILGAVIVAGITLRYGTSIMLALVCIGYFVSEKLADEVLRYRLFARHFGAWGQAMLARTGLQLLLVAIAWLAWQGRISGSLTVAALTAGNLAVFLPQIPGSMRRGTLLVSLEARAALLRRAARALVSNRLYWILAVLSAGIGYLDRIVALAVDRPMLPLFLLVVMCFAVVQMSVDFFYLSAHRRDFLQHQVTVGRALGSGRFLRSLFGGLVLAGFACAAVLAWSEGGAQFPLPYVVLLAVLQLALATTLIPREISYWGHPPRRLLRVELAFWVFFAGIAVGASALGFTLTTTLVLAAGCAALRLVLHVLLASRLAGKSPPAGETRRPAFSTGPVPDGGAQAE